MAGSSPAMTPTFLFRRLRAGLDRRALDHLGEIFRRLRARDRVFAGEDEAGHAVDAGFLGALRLVADGVDVLLAGEIAAYSIRVEPDIGGGFHQRLAVAQIGAFGE